MIMRLLVFFPLLLLLVVACTIVNVEVPVDDPIEGAIEVRQLENKFIYMKKMSFGGAGAGGMGAPVVHVALAEQFVDLVPVNEPIYVESGRPRDEEGWELPNRCVFTYWAFIENRAGLVQFENRVVNEHHRRAWCHVSGPSSVYFKFRDLRESDAEGLEEWAVDRGYRTWRDE
jgi:hypothetical protein